MDLRKAGLNYFLPACVLLLVDLASAAELRLLPDNQEALVYRHLLSEADKQFAERRRRLAASLVSREALAARRRKLSEYFESQFLPFPGRTPLNPKLVGLIEGDGYRVEKIYYESRPNHHVTANFYLPLDGEVPFPAVLVPCGHSKEGKAYDLYQKVCILLAKNGIAALSYDPIDQGERHQFPGQPAAEAVTGTVAHTLSGIGALLVGRNTAHYRVWDGIRSLDYLATRPEVDADRMGVTGNSGGGALASYLMVLDDRMRAAAPGCNITTVEGIFHGIGARDGENHFPNQGLVGFERADLLTLRAPKPTRILAATQDFFDIRGTHEVYQEAQKGYGVLGKPGQVDLFEYDDTHGFSKPRREKAVQWMRRWLLQDSAPVIEGDLSVRTPEELQVTGTGQVLLEWKNEVSVLDLNLREAKKLSKERKARRPTAEFLSEVKRLIAFKELPKLPDSTEVLAQERSDYRIRGHILRGEGGIPVPALIFLPQSVASPSPATLIVDDRGKGAEAVKGGLMEQLVREGQVVMSIDARGFGETKDVEHEAQQHYRNSDFRIAMLSMHIGRPLLGQRVQDVLAGLNFLLQLPEVNPGEVHLLGRGAAGPVVLHAAAFDPRISKVSLNRSIRSWLDVVANPLWEDQLANVVPAALTTYDLPDLVAAIAPRVVELRDPLK